MIDNKKSLQLLAASLEALPKTEDKSLESLKEVIVLVNKFSNETFLKIIPQVNAAIKENSDAKIQELIKNLKALRQIESLLNLYKGVMASAAPADKKE